jgi:hypothetical protein
MQEEHGTEKLSRNVREQLPTDDVPQHRSAKTPSTPQQEIQISDKEVATLNKKCYSKACYEISDKSTRARTGQETAVCNTKLPSIFRDKLITSYSNT